MLSRANQGSWNGGRVPYGYTYDKETGLFSVVEEEADVCRMMRDDYLEHRSILHTVKLLNSKGLKTRSGSSWSPTTVWIVLSSPFYAGIYRYNRHKGTKKRTVNPSGEWVLVYDHHPAVFSVEDWERMVAIREENTRNAHEFGKSKMKSRVYVFEGLAFCDMCGCRMIQSPGRVLAEGYRTATHTCPGKRKGICPNASVNDSVLGEFVLSYILNMLSAKDTRDDIKSTEDLQRILLRGTAFRGVSGIGIDGLTEFYGIIKSYGPGDRFPLKPKPPKKQKDVAPELRSLRKEKESCETALERLQSLYLFSPDAISEKDYLVRKKEITDRLNEATRKLGLIRTEETATVSDSDFIRMASHVIISDRLKNRQYIRYVTLASETSPDVLHEYMASIIDNIRIGGGRIQSITFRNGLTHSFSWE